jgi:putative hydrolase of the HAD superfamily
MKLRAILFDVNGTLVDIETDESRPDVYELISCFLRYEGLYISPLELRAAYFRLMQLQRKANPLAHPEIDLVLVWQTLLQQHLAKLPKASTSLPNTDRLEQLPFFLTGLHRASSRNRLKLYPDVKKVLIQLKQAGYRLGIVSDAQSAYAQAELEELGIRDFFEVVSISCDYGYRKPTIALFEEALKSLNITASEAIYVGNDMYRDVFGAQQAGMKAVFYPTQYGEKEYRNVKPDYIIYQFEQLLEAVQFFQASPMEALSISTK